MGPESRNRLVTLLLRDFRGGGAERSIIGLASGLAREGIPVDLVVLDSAGPFDQFLASEVRVVELGGPRKGLSSGLAVFRLTHYLIKQRPHRIISTLEALTIIAFIACHLARCANRLVIRVATTYDCEPRPALRRRLIEWVYRRHRGAFVTNSSGSLESLNRNFEIAPDRVEVIYNGIDIAAITAMGREPARIAMRRPAVLFVGRLSPAKRVDRLLRAFAQLPDSLAAQLIVVGDGPLRESLQSLATELAVQDRVSWVGFSTNPYAFMTKANTLVLSSDYEGMPSVLIEALACGLPVVSSDCTSGPREILDHGRYGELVPVGDEASLAAAIERTLESPRPKHQLEARAAEFDLGSTVEGYRRLLALPTSPC